MKPINFLPQSFLDKQRQKRRIYREAVLVLAVAGCVVVAWGARRGQTQALAQYARSLEVEAASAEDQQSEMVRLRAESQRLTRQAEIRRELSPPINATAVLDQLGDALPGSVTLTDFSMVAERPTPSKASASKKNDQDGKDGKSQAAPPRGPDLLLIEMEALAPDELTVARTVAGLSDHPLFSHVKMRYSRAARRDDVIGRSFKLSMRVDLYRDFQWQSPPRASAELSAVRAGREGVTLAD